MRLPDSTVNILGSDVMVRVVAPDISDAHLSLSTLNRILDTLHLALISHTVYEYSVSNFGNLIALLEPTWCVYLYNPRFYLTFVGVCWLVSVGPSHTAIWVLIVIFRRK